MSKQQDNKRIKKLKKLENLSIDNGSTPKLLVAIIYNFWVFFISAIVGGIVNDLFLYHFLVYNSVFLILLGSWYISKCDFGDYNFYRAKKILGNYEPVNKKKYDYFIKNFTEENNKFFWKHLVKFIKSETYPYIK